MVQRGAVPCPGPHSKRAAAQGEDAGVPDSRACVLDCMAPRTELPSPCQGSGAPCVSFPARETVEQMASVKPADVCASVTRDGHLQGLGRAEEAPPGPSRPPHPQGPKSAASHQSSLASLEGSGISERLPPKSLHQAGGPPLEVRVGAGPLPASPGASCLQAFAQDACCSCLCCGSPHLHPSTWTSSFSSETCSSGPVSF